ncbi:MAG: hypothetical protein JO076_00960 [Verrucomicrobia bacterium]|nr:hypothetical protein [Verrucomicrobiota bacterium]
MTFAAFGNLAALWVIGMGCTFGFFYVAHGDPKKPYVQKPFSTSQRRRFGYKKIILEAQYLSHAVKNGRAKI